MFLRVRWLWAGEALLAGLLLYVGAQAVVFFVAVPGGWRLGVSVALFGVTPVLLIRYYRWRQSRVQAQQAWQRVQLRQAITQLQSGQLRAATATFEVLARAGVPQAQWLLGRIHYQAKNYRSAQRWLRAARQRREAQFLLGLMHQNGVLGEKNARAAFVHYLCAAEQGLVVAQQHLAFLYLVGQGVDADIQQAKHWLITAAKRGSVEAQNRLGFLYYYGPGFLQQTTVSQAQKSGLQKSPFGLQQLDFFYTQQTLAQHYPKAYACFSRAARQGNATACYHLGVMHELAQGVAYDLRQAEYWYLLAAQQGDQDALAALQEIYAEQAREFDAQRIGDYLADFDQTIAATAHPQPPAQSEIQCPYCQAKLSITPPTQAYSVCCTHCQRRLRVSCDAQGQVHVAALRAARAPVPVRENPKIWYDALQLPTNASLETVRKTRKRLMQRYHPDKVAHLDYEQRAAAEEKSKRINAAYRHIVALLAKK